MVQTEYQRGIKIAGSLCLTVGFICETVLSNYQPGSRSNLALQSWPERLSESLRLWTPGSEQSHLGRILYLPLNS
jgi:hypothetical protein